MKPTGQSSSSHLQERSSISQEVGTMNPAAKLARFEQEAHDGVNPSSTERSQSEGKDDEEEWTDEEEEMSENPLAAALQILPREDTYKVLLMTFQSYKADYEEDEGEALEGSEELKKHFRTFLEGMEEDELLPDWWDETTKGECESLAEKFGWEPAGTQAQG